MFTFLYFKISVYLYNITFNYTRIITKSKFEITPPKLAVLLNHKIKKKIICFLNQEIFIINYFLYFNNSADDYMKHLLLIDLVYGDILIHFGHMEVTQPFHCIT